MPTVTVSEKYQLVIPREFRRQIRVRPGDELRVNIRNGSLQYVPIRTSEVGEARIREVRNTLRGRRQLYKELKDYGVKGGRQVSSLSRARISKRGRERYVDKIVESTRPR
jgi:AbrB family looped-hinge helix DNA binding protein